MKLQFKPGNRVRLKQAVNRDHEFTAPAGLTGTILRTDEDGLWVKMDDFPPVLEVEEWEGCIIWPLDDEDDLAIILDDLEVIGSKWIVHDWAGNRLFPDQEFDTFEDGWAHVRSNLPEEVDWEDIFVVEKDTEKDAP